MASIALVDTARHGQIWEVLAYNYKGEEVGGRFDTEKEAIEHADWLESPCEWGCGLLNKDCFCMETF